MYSSLYTARPDLLEIDLPSLAIHVLVFRSHTMSTSPCGLFEEKKSLRWSRRVTADEEPHRSPVGFGS